MLREKKGWVSERGGWSLVTVPTVHVHQTLPGPSLALFPKLVGCQERHVVTGVWVKSKGISCQLCMSGMSCVGGDGDCEWPLHLCAVPWVFGASGWCVHLLKHWDVWRKSYTMCGEILVPLNFKASRAVDPVFRQRPPTLCDFPCVQWKPLMGSTRFLPSATW